MSDILSPGMPTFNIYVVSQMPDKEKTEQKKDNTLEKYLRARSNTDNKILSGLTEIASNLKNMPRPKIQNNSNAIMKALQERSTRDGSIS